MRISNRTCIGVLITFLLFNVPTALRSQFTNSRNQSAHKQDTRYEIVTHGRDIIVRAGSLMRTITLDGTNLITAGLLWNGSNLLDKPSKEMAVTFYEASPNIKPVGIRDGDVKSSLDEVGTDKLTDVLKYKEEKGFVKQNTQWIHPKHIQSFEWNNPFDVINHTVSTPKPGVTRLTIRVRSTSDAVLQDVFINLFYEIYEGFPSIRKWIEIVNNGSRWLKADSLTLDGIEFNKTLPDIIHLTPTAGGAGASLRAYSAEDKSTGIIVGSEVPSALRIINPRGSTGYAPAFFEWVLGPAEKFTSEPVFIYGVSGDVKKTVSGISTPLDREVEGRFQDFLKEVVGVLPSLNDHLPLWSTWSNFGSDIHSENIIKMADLAKQAGFKGLEIDAGWAQNRNSELGNWASNSRPDGSKFRNFSTTANYIKNKGLKLGLWVSDYRDPQLAPDFKALPDAAALPHVYREGGLAMSFTSPWKYYFANDILYLHDLYGATYFKQDLTAIKYGDISAHHESRTHKESLLRGLRGLLESESYLIERAPDVVNQISHEIYWGTPGVPCDLAALKSVRAFHIPPNDYSGVGHPKKRYHPDLGLSPDSLRQKLLDGCLNARQRLYEYRGLPLNAIEYYAAATFNFNGSLTKDVQQRQVCSWLMGAPHVFAGDLSSLTSENLAHYKTCFDIVDELDEKYGIYRFFQFSGVPAPTDTDWHWWGKLNKQGLGAVVVLRGRQGQSTRSINIPWVSPTEHYQVYARFSKANLGIYTGRQLINGELKVSLSAYGQEILELSTP